MDEMKKMKNRLKRYIMELTQFKAQADNMAVYSMDEMNDANRASYYARQARIYEDVIKRLTMIIYQDEMFEFVDGRVDA